MANGNSVQFTPWQVALTTAGVAVGVYHGYKRDNSVGWALGWGLMGGVLPVVTIALAAAQGIGAPKRLT